MYELNHDGASIDEVSVCMINNNQNSAIGLAPIQFEAVNGAYTNMQFDVTGRVTLREYVSRNISQESFRRLMLNLIDTIEGFEEYMIDVRQVLLNIDCTFINELDHSVSFICIAVKGTQQSGDLFNFFREIVENSRVEASGNEFSYFHSVWNVIRSGTGFSLSNMRIAMNSTKTDANAAKQPVQQTAAPVQPAPVILQRPEEPETITVSSQPQFQPQPPVQQPVVPPVAPIEQDKKKGLFGGLFSQKKKKPETSSDSYQGGLAGLKNGSGKNESIPPQQPVQQMQPGPAAPVMNYAQVQTNPQQQMQMAPPAGTTVPNSKMPQNVPQPQNVQPAVVPPMGTTVLQKPMPPQQAAASNMAAYNSAAQTAPQNPAPPMGTTVLQKPMPPQQPAANNNMAPYNGTGQTAAGPMGTTVLNQSAPSVSTPPKPSVMNPATYAAPAPSPASPMGTTVLTQQPAPQPVQAPTAPAAPTMSGTYTMPTPPVPPTTPPPSSVMNPPGNTGYGVPQSLKKTPEPVQTFPQTPQQNQYGQTAGYGAATTVLRAPASSCGVLIRTKNGERIALNKSLIRIGRDRNDLDYCVNDNTAIGHLHANILRRGEDFFIVDLNSKNHTFINGMMIQGGVEIKLFNGDKIRLANENFEFSIL
ncbi:MAG: FHA domain-containing protein [Oscillospiraceae bacterium]|nr:FHA domain-containing protein [Oscillospiraceae bacterium]